MLVNMNAYSACPDESKLEEILTDLHARKDVLIVVNHAMWDMVRAGKETHQEAVHAFMGNWGNTCTPLN